MALEKALMKVHGVNKGYLNEEITQKILDSS